MFGQLFISELQKNCSFYNVWNKIFLHPTRKASAIGISLLHNHRHMSGIEPIWSMLFMEHNINSVTSSHQKHYKNGQLFVYTLVYQTSVNVPLNHINVISFITDLWYVFVFIVSHAQAHKWQGGSNTFISELFKPAVCIYYGCFKILSKRPTSEPCESWSKCHGEL